MRKPSI